MATSCIFIGLKVKKDTDCLFCELGHYGPLDLHNGKMDGTFMANSYDFESIDSIVSKICRWFYARLADPDCEEDVAKIIEIYGNDNFNKLLTSDLTGVISLTVLSKMEYYDEPYGASLLEYDVSSKELNVTNKDTLDYDDELDDRYREVIWDEEDYDEEDYDEEGYDGED